MVVENVTRDMVTKIEVGSSETYTLPDERACINVHTLVWRTKKVLKLDFKIKTDFENLSVTIKRTK